MERTVTAAWRATMVLLLAFVAYQQFQLLREARNAQDAERGAAFQALSSGGAPTIQKVEVVNDGPIPITVESEKLPGGLPGYPKPLPVRIVDAQP